MGKNNVETEWLALDEAVEIDATVDKALPLPEPFDAAVDAALDRKLSPKASACCSGKTHQCETGKKGCLHCDDCGSQKTK